MKGGYAPIGVTICFGWRSNCFERPIATFASDLHQLQLTAISAVHRAHGENLGQVLNNGFLIRLEQRLHFSTMDKSFAGHGSGSKEGTISVLACAHTSSSFEFNWKIFLPLCSSRNRNLELNWDLKAISLLDVDRRQQRHLQTVPTLSVERLETWSNRRDVSASAPTDDNMDIRNSNTQDQSLEAMQKNAEE